jgi:CelD/BcsL family acetyltransferase involved in cellulose biosynthesis
VFPPRIFLQNIFEPQIESLKKIAPCRIVSDTNYHVEVENWTTKSLSKGNRKKIRQFNEMGGVISFSNLSNIKQCYDILVENRRHRGVQLTMEFEDFKKSLILCEKDFKLIQANIGGNVIATSLLVKIMPDYWYVLYWGESIEFRNLSPVASIFYFLIEQAKSNKVVILDLGISSVNGTLDEGLARFKTNLGAVTSEKLSLELDLHTD